MAITGKQWIGVGSFYHCDIGIGWCWLTFECWNCYIHCSSNKLTSGFHSFFLTCLLLTIVWKNRIGLRELWSVDCTWIFYDIGIGFIFDGSSGDSIRFGCIPLSDWFTMTVGMGYCRIVVNIGSWVNANQRSHLRMPRYAERK